MQTAWRWRSGSFCRGRPPASLAPRIIATLFLFLAIVNVRGIRQSAWLVDTLTIAKLVPLGIFIAAGIPFLLRPAVEASFATPTFHNMAAAALVLIFTYGGFDVVTVPAGEARDPRRHMPFALTVTILVVTLIMTLAQAVSMSVLPDIATSRTPVADAAAIVLGAAGATLVAAGSVISMMGNNAGQVLSGSRMLYGVAENGDLPRLFARVHPRYGTPDVAIWFSSALALTLAVSGSFVALAAVSAVARLVIYVGTCAATLQLRRPEFASRVAPALWTTPGGAIVPVLAILVSLIILAGATRQQLSLGLAALAGGAVLFAFAPRDAMGRSPSPLPEPEA